MVNLLKQPRNKPLSAYSQLFILYVSKTKFFEEHVLAINGVDVDAYFSSLFAFIAFMSVLAPGKVAFEHQSSIEKAEVLEGLLTAHLYYFFETPSAALEPKTKLYFALNTASFDDTVDAGLKSATLVKEFKE